MIRPDQLRNIVVIPTLLLLGEPADTATVELMLGTAMQESKLGEYLHQLHGPALGLWQMEPATERDLWENYLAFRPTLRLSVMKLIVPGVDRTTQLQGNLYYACAMARLLYQRCPEPVPQAGDVDAQAAYYLKHYNAGGAATADEYKAGYKLLVAALAKS